MYVRDDTGSCEVIDDPKLGQIRHLSLVDFISNPQLVETILFAELSQFRIVVLFQAARDGSAVRLGVKHILRTVPGVYERAGLFQSCGDGDYHYDSAHCDAGDQADGSRSGMLPSLHPQPLYLIHRKFVGSVLNLSGQGPVRDRRSRIVERHVLALCCCDANNFLVLGLWHTCGRHSRNLSDRAARQGEQHSENECDYSLRHKYLLEERSRDREQGIKLVHRRLILFQVDYGGLYPYLSCESI